MSQAHEVTGRYVVDAAEEFYDTLVSLRRRQPFVFGDLSHELYCEARKCRRQTEAIEVAGTETYEDEREDGTRIRERNTYQVSDAVAAAVEARQPTVELPCGHTGIRNLGDGLFTCQGAPWCRSVHNRALIEGVLGDP